ncbi:MAG: hypothetical protein AAGF11_04970, partial [Myxococcota bacterium]
MPLDDPKRVVVVTRKLVEEGLGPDPIARDRLGRAVIACAEKEVVKILRRWPAAYGRHLVPEMTQDVALYLYSNDAFYLRYWDDRKGSFKRYLEVVAKGLIHRRFNQFRGNPAALDLVEEDCLEAYRANLVQIEHEMEYQIALSRLWEHIDAKCSPLDKKRFRARFIECKPFEEIANAEGIDVGAM